MTKKLNLTWLLFLTGVALLFLSANSLLAKAALINSYIDAYSFTFYRIVSGAFTLLILIYFKQKTITLSKNKNWLSAFMLFLYAITFSYSYLNLEAGLGTLLLFAVVQLTMIFIAFFKKENIGIQKIIGITIAFSGLVYLLFPSEKLELSFFHSFLMIIAGIAWAIYTVLGKNSTDALFSNYDNFVKATLFIILFYILFIDNTFITSKGIILAVISGSLTSAIGYTIWYVVLPQLKIVTASIIQLLVPIIAIFFSVLLLDEQLTYTLVISTLIILSGILITTLKKRTNN